MLDINMEFAKGILFVRLDGVLNESTVGKLKTDVTSLIEENGIRNTVFNVSELSSIDYCGINALLNNCQLCEKNNGRSMLCGVNSLIVKNKIKNSSIFKYMYEVSDELSAMNLINL